METLCSIGHAWGFLEGERRGSIPMRERSLRAATSHSRLLGDRGATDTRLGAGERFQNCSLKKREI